MDTCIGKVLDPQGVVIFQQCLNQLTDSPIYKSVSRAGLVGYSLFRTVKSEKYYRSLRVEHLYIIYIYIAIAIKRERERERERERGTQGTISVCKERDAC